MTSGGLAKFELIIMNLAFFRSYPTLLRQAVAGGAVKDGDADDHTHSKYDPADSNSSAHLEGETLSFDGEEADAANNAASKQYGCITVAEDSGEF